MIVALFVDERGHYMTDPRVDPWPRERETLDPILEWSP